MPRRLYLARHGETDSNLLKIIDGRGINSSLEYGSPLNHNGLLQAQSLGRALAEVEISRIYMSPARRAVATANQICHWANINNGPLEKSVVENLLEINFGVIEGLISTRAREKYPDLFKVYDEKPSQTIFPEGESVTEAYSRVSRALNKILAAHDHNENILIVSHGAVTTFIFIYIFKLDLDTMFHAIRHHNCGLSIIEWEKHVNPKIVCMNDISHLKNEHTERLK